MDRLIFIYNAKGGIANQLADAAHKLLSPATYPCSLCAITYGAVSMRREWRDYIRSLPYQACFYHSDELADLPLGGDLELPAILVQRGIGNPIVLIDAATLNGLKDSAELIALLDAKLAQASS